MTTIPQPADPTQSYTATYDPWNRLVKIADGGTTVAEYAYDGAKRRTIKKTYTGGSLDETRHYYYNEPSRWQVLEERVDASSDADRHFLWGLRYVDDLILRDRDTSDPKNGALNERLYALQDPNWNVVVVAGADGAVLERYRYSAYGMANVMTPAFASRASSSYGWEYRYTGRQLDNETGCMYYRNRHYQPSLGRFQERDPVRYEAGDVNLYRYVGNAPLIRVDPNGLFWIEAVKEILKQIAGSAMDPTSPAGDQDRHWCDCYFRLHCYGVLYLQTGANDTWEPWLPPPVFGPGLRPRKPPRHILTVPNGPHIKVLMGWDKPSRQACMKLASKANLNTEGKHIGSVYHPESDQLRMDITCLWILTDKTGN